MSTAFSTPNFWTAIAGKLGTQQQDATTGLSYVMLDHTTTMSLIVRTGHELFSTTASRAGAGLKVLVNGNFYDVTSAGMADAAWGSDPVHASETIILGRLVRNGAVLAGSSSPNLFYFAQRSIPSSGVYTSIFEAGFGDPPTSGDVLSAIGGLGPLIIGGLKYGAGNKYSSGAPAGAPATGNPGAAGRFLTQRNNNTFISANNRPNATGKTILASSSTERKLLVAAQQHGGTGTDHETIRDTLFGLGFDNAVFLDGSDSSMLMVGGAMVFGQGSNKNETNVVGVGFS